MARVQRAKRERTRMKIAAVARRLYYEQSYQLTSVGQIVEAAHVSRATFYIYYKNKLDVVSDLRAILRGKLVEQYQALAAISDPTTEDVRIWVVDFLALYRRERRIINIVNQILSTEPKNSGNGAGVYPQFQEILGATFPAFRSEGPDARKRAIAGRLLLFQLERFCHQLTFGRWEYDVDEAVNIMAENFFKFLSSVGD